MPAQGRARPARTQRELLDHCAAWLLGPAAGASELLAAVFADWPAFVGEHLPALLAQALHPPVPAFTPHPLGAASSD